MNWKREILVAAVVLAGVLFIACPKATPGIPTLTAPTGNVYQRATVSFKVKVADGGVPVRFVMDWGDGAGASDTTEGSYDIGEDALMSHRWDAVGDYTVKAIAILEDDPASASSEWSAPVTVTVLANDPPIAPQWVVFPSQGVKDRYTRFSAVATDPDGDSVSYQFMFDCDKNNKGAWGPYHVSGGIGTDSTKYGQVGDVYVKVRAKDIKGSEGEWNDSVKLHIDTTGAVVWVWQPLDEEGGQPLTSALVVRDANNEEVIYVGADDDEYGKFYAINSATGRTEDRGSSVEGENFFTGHPLFCAQSGNIIAGNEEGELFAFTKTLTKSWRFPDSSTEWLTYIEWGSGAVSGNHVYYTHDTDSLYHLLDNGGTEVWQQTFYHGPEIIMDAPVIDNANNVLFTTDAGKLYKLTQNLQSVWVKTLAAGVELSGPVIGGGGDIYVGSANGKVFAVNPADGEIKWTREGLTGEVNEIVLGNDAMYVGTGGGWLYKLNVGASGATVWAKQPSLGELLVAPMTTGNYVYCVDDDDVLYCIRQSDGSEAWKCPCQEYLPAASRRGGNGGRDIDDVSMHGAILSNGDIIVVGEDAVYCVAGYTAETLSGSWPKWQRDLHNTGKRQ